MKLISSLLFSIFVTTSLFSATGSYCDSPDGGSSSYAWKYSSTNSAVIGCYSVKPLAYRRDCTDWSMSETVAQTTQLEEQYDNCPAGNYYGTSTKTNYTYMAVSQCNSPQIVLDGICQNPPCDSSDPLLDCDNDGIPNNQEPEGDYDNDGVPNQTDSDDDNDGIPDEYDDYLGNGTSNGNSSGVPSETDNCEALLKAALVKCPLPAYNLKFNCITTNEGLPFVTQDECIQVQDPCEDIFISMQNSCKAPKAINGTCNSNNGLITMNTLSCDSPSPLESPCDVARSNMEATCKSPNYIVGRCQETDGVITSNTFECKNNEVPTENNGSIVTENEQQQTEALSENINQNTDRVINKLDELKIDTTKSSDTLLSIDSKLSSIISQNSKQNDFSNIEQQLGYSNGKLDDIKDNTYNTAVNTAQSADSLSAINAKLDDFRDLDGSFSDGVNSVNTSNIDIDTSSMDETAGIMDELTDNLDYLTDDITSISTQFTELKDLINGDDTVLNISSGSCSNDNMNRFASYISPYSSAFALITYVSMMFMIFRFIFSYMSRGE